MCSYGCGIDAHISGGRINKVTGNLDHPFNRGLLCAKGRAILDWVMAPDRQLFPMKRVGNSWREIDLDTALKEIGVRIEEIMSRYPPQSLAVWVGEGVGFNQGRKAARVFAHSLGSPNYLSNDTLCAVSKKAAITQVLGAFPLPEFEKTSLSVIWGSNPAASALFLAKRIQEARASGAGLIVVDPRRTPLARWADLHLRPRPGTDGALALGLISLLIKQGAGDPHFVRKYTVGFEELAEYAGEFTPGRVQEETGIPVDDITRGADMLAGSRGSVSHLIGVGPEHHANGFDNIRAIGCLMALSGSVDHPGGNYLPDPLPLGNLGQKLLPGKPPIGAARYPIFSRVHGEGHTLEALKAVMTGHPYPIRAAIMSGANPVLTNPNSVAVRKALSQLDLLVVRDLFMTSTARLAHYFIPAASFLERSELLANPYLQLLQLSPRIGHYPGCLGEYDFWRQLAVSAGTGQFFPKENEDEVNSWLLEPMGMTREQLLGLTSGYQYAERRYKKYLDKGFATPSGRIELVSRELGDLGHDPVPRYRPPSYLMRRPGPGYSFALMSGARQAQFEHSRHRNISRLRSTALDPALEMNPEDARRLSISPGDWVLVESDTGSLRVRVRVMDPSYLGSGVVHLGHGWDEANVNLLTPDHITDPISGFPPLKSTLVHLRKAVCEPARAPMEYAEGWTEHQSESDSG